MRSTRQRRAVPPKRRSTPSSAWTRCGRSWDSLSTARAWLEYDNAPTSTCALPPHGAPGRSAQSHCCSAPGGWSMSTVSRPLTPAQASQCGRPHVAVLGQPRRRVVGERGERIGPRRAALARGAVPIEVGTDRLGVTAKMAGDRCDRPALRAERCCLHVFLPCEHGPGLPDAAASHTASIREPHPLWWTLPPPPGSKWGVQ